MTTLVRMKKQGASVPSSDGVLLEMEKDVPQDVIDTGLDEVAASTPEKELRSNDKLGNGNEFGSRSTFYRPGVDSWKTYHRPAHFSSKKIGNITVTKNGLFQPTLMGASTVNSRTPQLVRKRGAEGAPLPLDGLRLTRSQLSLPVTRL